MAGVGDTSLRAMMSVLFFLTASLNLFLSNTASAVLVAPVALRIWGLPQGGYTLLLLTWLTMLVFAFGG
jgi:di/tricarboxylate transporter